MPTNHDRGVRTSKVDGLAHRTRRPLPFLVWAALAAAVVPKGGLSFVPVPAPLEHPTMPSWCSTVGSGMRRGRVGLIESISMIGGGKDFDEPARRPTRTNSRTNVQAGKGDSLRRGHQRPRSRHPRSFIHGDQSARLENALEVPGFVGLGSGNLVPNVNGINDGGTEGPRAIGDDIVADILARARAEEHKQLLQQQQQLQQQLQQMLLQQLPSSPHPPAAGPVAATLNLFQQQQQEQQLQLQQQHLHQQAKAGSSAQQNAGQHSADAYEEDSTSVRFLGGWAETFPSMVHDSRIDSPTPVRIPFLLGTNRGQRPAMAILAPPESMTLYKRIPFLKGTSRPPSDLGACVGMGEDVVSSGQKAMHVEKAQMRAVATKLQFLAWRTQSLQEEEQRRSGCKSISAAPKGGIGGDVTFEEADVCDGLVVLDGGMSIRKVAQATPQPGFAVWSRAFDSGVSSWTLRIDSLAHRGVMFVGCLVEPFGPATGFARNLGTPAWMLGSYGYVCRTSAKGQEPLTKEVKEQLGDNRIGILSFKTGSIVRMTLDRDARALKVQINDLPAFTLHNVASRSRPFVNLAMEGDGVSLIPEDGGRRAHVRGSEGEVRAAKVHKVEVVSQEELQRIRDEADRFWP